MHMIPTLTKAARSMRLVGDSFLLMWSASRRPMLARNETVINQSLKIYYDLKYSILQHLKTITSFKADM